MVSGPLLDKLHNYNILITNPSIFFSSLKKPPQNCFKLTYIGEHMRQYWYICHRPLSANNIAKPIYQGELISKLKKVLGFTSVILSRIFSESNKPKILFLSLFDVLEVKKKNTLYCISALSTYQSCEHAVVSLSCQPCIRMCLFKGLR